jgi:hypothetical protein
MDLEEIVVDMPSLHEAHRDKNINNLSIYLLRKLQRDMLKGKATGSSQGMSLATIENLGIKTNPLKSQKKSPGEEKNKGRKPHRQKIEETGALMVNPSQVVRLLDNCFPSQPKC